MVGGGQGGGRWGGGGLFMGLPQRNCRLGGALSFRLEENGHPFGLWLFFVLFFFSGNSTHQTTCNLPQIPTGVQCSKGQMATNIGNGPSKQSNRREKHTSSQRTGYLKGKPTETICRMVYPGLVLSNPPWPNHNPPAKNPCSGLQLLSEIRHLMEH